MVETPPKGVAVFAPAKINLTLHITGKRANGYHTLESLIAFAKAGDRIHARPAAGLNLNLNGPHADSLRSDENENLVLTAARRFADLAACPPNVAITLTKNLPVAAGLGGGSADAAATLRALMDLWHVQPQETELMELALSLGADVPVCLHGHSAFVGGIGEVMTPAPPLPPAWSVLVNPRVALATADVFRAREGAFTIPATPWDAAPETVPQLARCLRTQQNDLESAARRLAPEIDACLAMLSDTPACLLARMSGSGATCFGLFEDSSAAREAAGAIARQQPGWWVHPARLGAFDAS